MELYVKNQYIDFHNESKPKSMAKRDTGLGPKLTSALCDRFKEYETFELFRPSDAERELLRDEGKSSFAWGSDDYTEKFYQYTSLRQTIVLFCAAIHGEL